CDLVVMDRLTRVGEVGFGGGREVEGPHEEAGHLGAGDRTGGTELGVVGRVAAASDAGRRQSVDVGFVYRSVVVEKGAPTVTARTCGRRRPHSAGQNEGGKRDEGEAADH